MRKINFIVVHCTATQPNTTVKSILDYWKNILNWKNPGYHYLIQANGVINTLLPEEQVSNGVAGFNSQCINVSYIGGVDANGKPSDTRTEAQKQSLLTLLGLLKEKYPTATIQGHRDFPNVKKACPSFDAKTEYSTI